MQINRLGGCSDPRLIEFIKTTLPFVLEAQRPSNGNAASDSLLNCLHCSTCSASNAWEAVIDISLTFNANAMALERR